MPKVTKIIDEELVNKARDALGALGDNGIVAIRLRAIIASYKHSIKIVSEVFGINRSSLHRWVLLFKNGGIESLKNIKKPPRSKLNQEQQLIVRSWVENDNTITIKKIVIMIKDNFDSSLSKSSIHRMLINLGFSHITGRTKHYKANYSAQAEFKKKSTRKNTK